MAKRKKSSNKKYTEPLSLYFTKPQREKIAKRGEELGWPDDVKYCRRLVVKHLPDNEIYIDPDEA